MKEIFRIFGSRTITVVVALLFGAAVMHAQNFAVSTNIADYADFGTLNVEAAYGVAQHWTLNAEVKYNPFSYGRGEDEMRRRQRSVSTGARWWPWHVFSGWWLGADLKYQEYNIGGIESRVTAEGDRVGAIIGGGYTYMISPRLNLDLGFGVWSGYDNYRTYECQTCGRVIGEGERFFVNPAEIILALTYIF